MGGVDPRAAFSHARTRYGAYPARGTRKSRPVGDDGSTAGGHDRRHDQAPDSPAARQSRSGGRRPRPGRGMTRLTHIDETVTIGGDLTVGRIGYGAMQLTGPKVWGEYPDHDKGV